MCGRGGLDYDWKTLWHWLDLDGAPPDGGVRRLNVAPSRRRRDRVDWATLPVVRLSDGGAPSLTGRSQIVFIVFLWSA